MMKVLIIERNELMRQLLKVYFQKNGFQAASAAAAGVPHRLLEMHRPGVILIGVQQFSELDGLQSLCEAARTAQVPVIVLTPSQIAVFREACADAGVSALVLMPFLPEELKETVTKVAA